MGEIVAVVVVALVCVVAVVVDVVLVSEKGAGICGRCCSIFEVVAALLLV